MAVYKRLALMTSILMILALLSACSLGSETEKTANPYASEENPLAGTYMPDFSTTDLDGKALDSLLFYEAELTMINIWGTYCGPCIAEMPELERLSKDLAADNIKVIGVLMDEDVDSARAIAADTGVSFPTLLMDDSLRATLGKFQYVPTTIFVDGKGQIMAEIAVGARGYEAYKALAKAALTSSTTVQAGSGSG